MHKCDVSSQHQTASSRRFPLLREPLAVVDRVAGPDASKSRFCSGHPASRSGSMTTLRMRLKVQGPMPPGPRCLHPPPFGVKTTEYAYAFFPSPRGAPRTHLSSQGYRKIASAKKSQRRCLDLSQMVELDDPRSHVRRWSGPCLPLRVFPI